VKLEDLNKKVEEVYAKCIGSNEANISTLQMLTKIEKRMEELFQSLEKLPKDYVVQAEKVIHFLYDFLTPVNRQKKRKEDSDCERISWKCREQHKKIE
jgi:hypothetical protein